MDFFIYLSDYSITGFCFSSSVPYFSRFVLWSSLETSTSVGMILRSVSSPSFSSMLHFQLFARLVCVCVCVCVPPTSPRWQVPKLIYFILPLPGYPQISSVSCPFTLSQWHHPLSVICLSLITLPV